MTRELPADRLVRRADRPEPPVDILPSSAGKFAPPANGKAQLSRSDTPSASTSALAALATAAAGKPPLVEVRDLAKTFDVSAPWLNRVIEGKPKLLLHAVDGVSFSIAPGETLALVGESGCGKSTLARLLVGLYRPTRGSVRIDGQSLGASGSPADRALRRRIQMIFQDPYASLNPRWKVSDIIAEPIRVHRLLHNEGEVSARVGELLAQVGLARGDALRFPHQFSGGQRQRISIARALASMPEFLVCDEPSSALDVSVQAQVLNLMRDLQRRNGLAYLFISHNLAVVHHVADRIGVMYLGRIVELASRQALFDTPRHPYTRMLLDAIPDIGMTGRARTPVAGEVPNPLDPPSGCSFHPRCPLATEHCRREQPELRVLADGSSVACHAVAEV